MYKGRGRNEQVSYRIFKKTTEVMKIQGHSAESKKLKLRGYIVYGSFM